MRKRLVHNNSEQKVDPTHKVDVVVPQPPIVSHSDISGSAERFQHSEPWYTDLTHSTLTSGFTALRLNRSSSASYTRNLHGGVTIPQCLDIHRIGTRPRPAMGHRAAQSCWDMPFVRRNTGRNGCHNMQNGACVSGEANRRDWGTGQMPRTFAHDNRREKAGP